MNENINQTIIEEIKKMDIEDNKKNFLVEILNYEYEISNQVKPKFSSKYRELVNKYIM